MSELGEIGARAIARGDLDYAAFYCEENVWRLAGDPRLAGSERWVIFISNRDRAFPIWSQRSAPAPNEPAVWDYHVVLAVRSTSGVVIYDLDSRLELAAPARAYFAASFPFHDRLSAKLAPRFRLIEAARFREVFASDRSHMRQGSRWKAPPPPWPAIRTPAETMNLMRFIDVDDRFEGERLALPELLDRLDRLGPPA